MEKYLCSGSKLSFQFIIKWFAKMARGFKNDSCLYLKGPQGIGKSCIIEWIRQYVIGIPLCFQGGSGPLKTRFNGELAGKLLVVFEELENFTTVYLLIIGIIAFIPSSVAFRMTKSCDDDFSTL